MNNTELMILLKKVNQTDVQRKALYVMGGIIALGIIGFVSINKRNRAINSAHLAAVKLNNEQSKKIAEHHRIISQKNEHISKLLFENQGLQKMVIEMKNQNSI